MKKSLLMILSAALLFVGCTKELEQKVTDLEGRVADIEAQVAANQQAITVLQGQTVVSSVQTTGNHGVMVTLSDASVLYLYCGSNSNDRAGLVKSVSVANGVATIEFYGMDPILVPIKANFEFILATNDLVVKPGKVVEVPYTISEEATVSGMGDGFYKLDVDAKAKKIIITVPEIGDGETLPASRLLVFADNGAGKSSIKTIDIDGQIIGQTSVASKAYFWGGTSTVKLFTNVDFTAVVDEADAAFATVAATKTVAEHSISVNIKATPYADSRVAHIHILDPDGEELTVLEAVQEGTGGAIYVSETETFYDSFAKAVKALNDAKATTATLYISGYNNNGMVWDFLEIAKDTQIKTWNITRRSSVHGATPEPKRDEVKIRGIHVFSNDPELVVNAENFVCIADGAATTKDAGEAKQFDATKYPTALYVGAETKGKVTFNNVAVWGYFYGIPNNDGTFLAVNQGSAADVTVKNCYFDGTNINYAAVDGIYNVTPITDGIKLPRIGQIYGGNVTFDGNVFINGYGSYAVRVGYDASVPVKATFTNNVANTAAFVDAKAGADITFGDGTKDNNTYSKTCTPVKIAAGATVKPEGLTLPTAITVGDFAASTINGALALAEAGDTITVNAGEYVENVKIAPEKDVVIIANGDVVVKGNVEVAGKAVLEGLKICTLPGVTNNVLLYETSTGYNWGHPYLIRVCKGADLTIKNCELEAVAEDETLMNGLSMIFACEADLAVEGTKFTAQKKAAYCHSQVYEGTVLFKNNTFSGNGKKNYSVRLGAGVEAAFTGNTFALIDAAPVAIDIINTFTGKLTLGDGVTDDNVYGANIAFCINLDPSAKGTFLPETMAFNKPYTRSALALIYSKTYADLSIPTTRNATIYDGKVFCVAQPVISTADGTVTSPLKLYEVNAEGTQATERGFVAGTFDNFTGYAGGNPQIIMDGATPKVLMCNVTGPGNQWAWGCGHFIGYLAPANTTDAGSKFFDITVPNADPTATANGGQKWTRSGDYVHVVGNMEDGKVLIGMQDPSKNNSMGIVPIKNGVAGDLETISMTCAQTDNVAGISLLGTDVVVRSVQTANSEVFTFDGTTLASIGSMSCCAKTLRLFTLDGVDYIAYVTYVEKEAATLHIAKVELGAGTLAEFVKNLTAADDLFSFVVEAKADNGNKFAGCNVDIQGKEAKFVVYVMNNSISVISLDATLM